MQNQSKCELLYNYYNFFAILYNLQLQLQLLHTQVKTALREKHLGLAVTFASFLVVYETFPRDPSHFYFVFISFVFAYVFIFNSYFRHSLRQDASKVSWLGRQRSFCGKRLISFNSFVCSFARSFAHSFVRAFVRSSVRSCVRACVRWFGRSFVRSFVCSCYRVLVCSFVLND